MTKEELNKKQTEEVQGGGQYESADVEFASEANGGKTTTWKTCTYCKKEYEIEYHNKCPYCGN